MPHTHHRKKFLPTFIIALLASALLFPAPASAGTITSHLSNARTGFQSQRFNHQNNGAIRATLSGCSQQHKGATPKLDIELRHHRRAMPDRSLGSRDYRQCFYTTRGNS